MNLKSNSVEHFQMFFVFSDYDNNVRNDNDYYNIENHYDHHNNFD